MSQSVTPARPSLRHRAEFLAVRTAVALLRLPSRSRARSWGAAVGRGVYHLHTRLRETGISNLQKAYPEWSQDRCIHTLKEQYRSLGWQLAEFAQMNGYTLESTADFVHYEGLEHYLAAAARGRGVLVVTGHLGAWELSSFYHSLAGHPMGLVIRRLDNPMVDAFVNRVRCLHGNRVIAKDDFARGLIAAMHAGETVGVLMDTNMTPPQGVFVPFFGRPACTASGVARIALKTDAAVLPGFLTWHEDSSSYVLRFGPEFTLKRTGDPERDILANTATYTAAIEAAIRQVPEQWLWMHRRWKTQPTAKNSAGTVAS